jgi:ABC transporter family protein
MTDDTQPSAPETPSPPPVHAAPSAAPIPYQAPARRSKLGWLGFAGLFAGVAGLAWWMVEPETTWITSTWIFLSLVAIFVPVAWHLADIVAAVTTRRGGAVAMVAVTVVLGLFVLLFVGWLDVRLKKDARLPVIDLTRASRYTLSDESLKLLSKIDGTVYATYLKQGEGDDATMELRADALEQLRVFQQASSHVRVQDVDAVRDRERADQILREQGAQATTSGEDADVIVLTYAEAGREVAPGKQKEIKVEQWAFKRQSMTGADKWLGESAITNAIYELVFQKYKAYTTAGHGERSFSDEFHELKGALNAQNIEVASEPLVLTANPNVPKDCELLMVLAPTTPFTPEEMTAISTWLDGGKTLLVALDVQDDRKATGLEPVFDKFGVAVSPNYEVLAATVTRLATNQGGMQAVDPRMRNQFPVYGDAYADHPGTKALRARAGLATYFFKSTYVEIDDKPPEGAHPEAVCYAPRVGEGERAITPVALSHYAGRSDYSVLQRGKDKVDGKFALVATSTRKLKGLEGGDARLIVSGDSDLFSDRVIQSYPANLDLARGLVQWGLRREGLVAVSERTLEDPYVTPTEYQRRFATVWPAAVSLVPLIVAVMVWWARRR